MNENEANIDLLFRNGLKDFEVIPPPGVWDGIRSAIKMKFRSHMIFRVAAVVTVLLALSFLTYEWSRNLLTTHPAAVMAINEPALQSVSEPIDNKQVLPAKKIKQVKSSSVVLNVISDTGKVQQEAEIVKPPEQIMDFRETKSLSIVQNGIADKLFMTPLMKYQANPAKIKYADLQYFPDNVITKPQKRWSIAALASPTYYSSFNSGTDALSKELSTSEQPLISYSGGIAFSFKISKRFSIQSGLYYSSLDQRVDGINSFNGFQKYDNSKGDHNFEVLTTSGTIYTSNPDVFLSSNASDRIITNYTADVFDPAKANLQQVSNSIDQNFSYLELPVVLKYKIIDKTLGINLIGGLSYNLLVNNSVYTTVDGSKYSIGKTEGLNSLALSSSLGMGMEYNLSSKLSLNLEPTFRYYLNPFSVSTGSYAHPYSFGIFSGVSYKF